MVAAIEIFISGNMNVITVIVTFSWKRTLCLNCNIKCNDVSFDIHWGMETQRVVIIFVIKSLNCRGNSVVKRAQAGVILGWVTSREVLVLHPCEHHLDPMSAKCSIYSHERWIHVESLLMKYRSSSLTQNHTVKSWYSHHNLTSYGNHLLLINWWA